MISPDYSQWNLIKKVIQNYTNNNSVLPIANTDSIKCLDYDMDNITFKPLPRSHIKFATVNPYNKTLYEVMEMV